MMTAYRRYDAPTEIFRPGVTTLPTPRPGGTSSVASRDLPDDLTRVAGGEPRHHSAAPRYHIGRPALVVSAGVPRRARGRVYRSRSARRRGRVLVAVMAFVAVLGLPSAPLIRPFWGPLASMALFGCALVGVGILLFVAGARPSFRFEAPEDRGGAR